MILRERQKVFVEKSEAALRERGNTLGVAPTGSGKTIMLAAVVGRLMDANGSKACILAHRDEITGQNVDKFLRVNPGMAVSIVDAAEKSWSGKAVFAMVQTLARRRTLELMPRLDLLVIDEAHHARAETYRRIIDAAKARNPALKVFGVTATPNRGDGKSLRDIFDNMADQITLGEMIAAGQLVRPRTFVVDLGVQEDLKNVRRLASEFDMGEVATIMDRTPLTQEILRHWSDKAADRPTVVFCSTIDHAAHVTEAFRSARVSVDMVTGETPDKERADTFARLDSGTTQVLVNVAVATEGWDCPPISCVVLLRPCSHKSTMIQMIGRGLRKLDPERYPGLVKTDCVVLDFGATALMHGSLEQQVNLDGHEGRRPGEAPFKVCPSCKAEVPLSVRECPFCEHKFQQKARAALGGFEMTEVDLLDRSPFEWCELAQDGSLLMATGFNAWGGVVHRGGLWHAVGGCKGTGAKVLYVGERLACLASADDWLNLNESEDMAHKSRRWLQEPPTEKQLQYLPRDYLNLSGITRYKASCILAHVFNRRKIELALAHMRSRS